MESQRFLEKNLTNNSHKNSEMWKLYRFADKAEEVNWDARYKSNEKFLEFIIPYLIDYTEESIKKVTFEENNLRAVVGLSGGLDSCVSAFLTAETMRLGINRGSSKSARLALLSFDAMSSEDFTYSKRFEKFLKEKFRNIEIISFEKDLRHLIKNVHNLTDDMIRETNAVKIYPGELASRMINTLTLEYADKTGHCCIDSTNGTEIILGEIVLGSGFEYSPLGDFYKSQVFDIAESLGIPKYIINRNPINSTFGIDKINSYFGEIPKNFSARDVYAILDPVLFYIFERKMKPITISKKLGHSKKFVEKVYQRIKSQDHRRKPPYFALNDRKINFSRIIKDKSNKYFKEYLEESFSC